VNHGVECVLRCPGLSLDVVDRNQQPISLSDQAVSRSLS
jgi:hypothetical protein